MQVFKLAREMGPSVIYLDEAAKVSASMCVLISELPAGSCVMLSVGTMT